MGKFEFERPFRSIFGRPERSTTVNAILAGVLLSSVLFVGMASAAVVTIEGVVDKVVPEKTEIYVLADGKRHEFYFNDKTEVTQGGKPASFSVLKKAQKVKVTADKIGKRLDPIKVELIE